MNRPPDLDSLARSAREMASEWGLDLDPPFALCHYSYVAPGDDAVLKVTSAEDDEFNRALIRGAYLGAGEDEVRVLRALIR